MDKNHGDRAAELFLSGCSCAQSVMAAFDDVTGLDRDTSLRVSSAMGGGICRMREVCGAVSGAMMVLGMAEGSGIDTDHDKKAALYARGQEFCKAFKEKMGSVVCREILGLAEGRSDSVPERRTSEYYKKRPCAEIVRCAASILERMLEEKEV